MKSSNSEVLPIGISMIIGFILFLSCSNERNWTFNWKGIRPEIRDTVKLIEDFRSVTSGVVGYYGVTPQQWYRRRWLMKNANEEELKRLLDYHSGAVKVTAYEGLIRRLNSNNYELIKQALNDTTTFFNYQVGCIGSPKMVGEYLVENVIPISNRFLPSQPEIVAKYNLSEEQVLNLIELYDKRIDNREVYLKGFSE